MSGVCTANKESQFKLTGNITVEHSTYLMPELVHEYRLHAEVLLCVLARVRREGLDGHGDADPVLAGVDALVHLAEGAVAKGAAMEGAIVFLPIRMFNCGFMILFYLVFY